ncbi:MAG TPA: hypothetical protein VEF04_00235 [Blastocatellia bacterium]|nr:hypothetical protein [Blastocatellia bacterium]
MTKILLITSTLAALSLVVLGTTFQSQPAFAKRVQEYFKEKEPEWELSRKDEVGKALVFHWQSGKEQTSVDIETYASAEEAQIRLRQRMMLVNVPPKSHTNKIGDETVLYQSDKTQSGTLFIRKGSIFIQVDSTSITHAERFAKRVIDLVSAP